MDKQLPKVLIVEDEAFMLKIYKLKLTKAGFDVDTAEDGEIAIQKAKEGEYSLILLDLILPKIDGFQVMEQLKNDPQTANIPVIVTSNLAQESDISNAKKLGAVEYLVKANVSIDELVDHVKKALSQPTEKQ